MSSGLVSGLAVERRNDKHDEEGRRRRFNEFKRNGFDIPVEEGLEWIISEDVIQLRALASATDGPESF